MAPSNNSSVLSRVMMIAAMLAFALPPGVFAVDDFPYFAPFSTPQSVCKDKSFAKMPLKGAKTNDCDALQSNLKRDSGQYIVGAFDTDDDWMAIGCFESCYLAFKATEPEDAANNGQWFIGNNDAYKLVTDAIEGAFVDGEGAAEGIMPCRYSGGGYKDLYWRVWDARD